jgi:hypothetical protein
VKGAKKVGKKYKKTKGDAEEDLRVAVKRALSSLSDTEAGKLGVKALERVEDMLLPVLVTNVDKLIG